MASRTSPSAEQSKAQAERKALLERIGFLGARPFEQQAVQSPWNTVLDVPSLHREVKERIRLILQTCGQSNAIRCLTVTAPSGYGKTHLLAWTRQLLDDRNDTVFIYVPPYTPGPGSVLPEQHVMRAAIDALSLRSRRQRACFEQAARAALVGCYDGIIDSGRGIKEILQAGSFWSRLFRRYRLRITPQAPQDQLAALQRAFHRRAFLEQAFASFTERHPSCADGVYPDWDTFVAACLLTCGNTRQRWHADRWFRGERAPADVLEPFHIDQPCQGTEKIRNGLFTLQQMVGQSFCLAFDQLEDTYLAVFQPGASESTRFAQMLGVLWRNLSVMPGFCLLFVCQTSIWQNFAKDVSPMLVDRMTEGYRAQNLRALDDATARDLVQERMASTVWKQLLEGGPPPDEPCFPFTAAEVRKMRIDTGGELRVFLQRLQQEFEKQINPPAKPPAPIRLTAIEPREVMRDEPTAILIRGENLPTNVHVLFAGQPPSMPPVCHPAAGQIDVTTPSGLEGDVEVTVQAADDSGNAASIMLHFASRAIPRPYQKFIDGQRLRERRLKLGLSQREVAGRIGIAAHQVGNMEKGAWRSAPDDAYVRLAEVYGAPLSHFLRDRT